jgi:hypothetical protein
MYINICILFHTYINVQKYIYNYIHVYKCIHMYISIYLRPMAQRASFCCTILFLFSITEAWHLAIWLTIFSCSFFLSWKTLLGKDQKKFALPILSLKYGVWC